MTEADVTAPTDPVSVDVMTGCSGGANKRDAPRRIAHADGTFTRHPHPRRWCGVTLRLPWAESPRDPDLGGSKVSQVYWPTANFTVAWGRTAHPRAQHRQVTGRANRVASTRLSSRPNHVCRRSVRGSQWALQTPPTSHEVAAATSISDANRERRLLPPLRGSAPCLDLIPRAHTRG